MLTKLFGPERLSWRRLAALVLATGLLVSGHLTEQSWVLLAVAFIGGDTLQRVLARS